MLRLVKPVRLIATYLCSVLLDILSVAQISSTQIDLSRNSLLASTTFGALASVGGRPPLRPRARAAARPAFVVEAIHARTSGTNSQDATVNKTLRRHCFVTSR